MDNYQVMIRILGFFVLMVWTFYAIMWFLGSANGIQEGLRLQAIDSITLIIIAFIVSLK